MICFGTTQQVALKFKLTRYNYIFWRIEMKTTIVNYISWLVKTQTTIVMKATS